jgi:hypothetical protein
MYRVLICTLAVILPIISAHAAWAGKYTLVLITFTVAGNNASTPTTTVISTFTKLTDCTEAANDTRLLQIPNVGFSQNMLQVVVICAPSS